MRLTRMLSFVVLVTALGGFLLACGGDNAPVVVATGSVGGQVTDPAGTPLAGVTVTSPSAATRATTTTGADGVYELTGLPVGTDLVTFAGANLLGRQAPVLVVADQRSHLDICLRPAGAVHNIDATRPQTVADTRADGLNATVLFQANSILDANHRPVAAATVQIAMSVPSDTGYADFFPGLFVGVGPGSTTGPLESFGFVDVTLTTGGQPAHLDPSLPATLHIPVAPGHDPGDATLPLWSLNPATGQWTYEGEATRNDTGVPVVYGADVTHFTPYNLDKYFSGGNMTLTVRDDAGNLIAGASIIINSYMTAGAWQGRATTNAAGTATLTVPAGFVVVQVTKGSLTGTVEGHATANASVTIR